MGAGCRRLPINGDQEEAAGKWLTTAWGWRARSPPAKPVAGCSCPCIGESAQLRSGFINGIRHLHAEW